MQATLVKPVQGLAGSEAGLFHGVQELVVYCPGCKTLETLSFNEGWLMQTRKFSQRNGQVYHDCGSIRPCRLYKP